MLVTGTLFNNSVHKLNVPMCEISISVITNYSNVCIFVYLTVLCLMEHSFSILSFRYLIFIKWASHSKVLFLRTVNSSYTSHSEITIGFSWRKHSPLYTMLKPVSCTSDLALKGLTREVCVPEHSFNLKF